MPQYSVLYGFRITRIAFFLAGCPPGFSLSASPVQAMRVNHGGSHIVMAQEFLHHADVIATLKQILWHSGGRLDCDCFANCFLDGPLENPLVMEMILRILPYELFWDIVCSPYTGNRSLAQTTDTDVLLETVATMSHESPQSF